jgi:hypothetical protein
MTLYNALENSLILRMELSMQAQFEKLKELVSEIADINHSMALLGSAGFYAAGRR